MLRTSLVLAALTTTLSAGTKVFQAFEGDGFNDWKVDGPAFGLAPAAGKTDGMKSPFTAYANDGLAISAHGGDPAKGTLTSPEFTLAEPYITFLLAGGNEPGKTAAQLLVDGKVELESVGKRSMRLEPVVWDVARFKGKKAVIRLVDDSDAPWGVIAVDHILLTDYPNQKFPATTRAGKAFVEGLQETPAIPGVNIPIGSAMKVLATHKDRNITSPTALTFDEQGRIYISETHRFREGVEDDRDHLYWYLDDLASKKVEDRRALHEKWKEKVPLDRMTRKSEVIRRLADTDGDGQIDEDKVFADGFNDVLDGTAAGVFYYEGCLYFACIPKVYMLLDKDGDGKAEERKVVQEGFGVRISLSGHDLNGFTLGPDGRIYGTVGDRGLSFVTKEGKDYQYPNEGAAFRFEPDGSGFELFHTGLRNPKEIAFDALGNAFSVDNNSDQGDAARVVYLVEGGDSGWQMEHQAMHSFHRQIGLKDHPPARWMDERMWELENPDQPAYILPPSGHLTAGPSGLTYHPGAGFLESENNRFLVCDYRGGSANSGIWSFEMKPKGAGMEIADARQFVWGVAATDVEYSWDGKVYITDFMGGWESHQDGRLLSLDAGDKTWQANDVAGAARLLSQGFDQRASSELTILLRHPDMRVRLRAQIAITRKPDAITRFTEAVSGSNRFARIHGIWGLGIVSRRGSSPLPAADFADLPVAKNRKDAEAKLLDLLKDSDPEIRVQALRALGDSGEVSQDLPIGPLLADPSPRVRFHAAILAGKRKMIGQYSSICELLAKNDNTDVYLRHAGVYALQHMAANPTILTTLATEESAAVRLAATVALRRMKNPGVALFIRDADPRVADEAIRAICDLDMQEQRPNVAELLDEVESREWKPFMLRRLIHNSYRIGTLEDATRLAKFSANPGMPRAVREEALRLLSIWTEPFPADQFTGHWSPLEKRGIESVRPALLEALPDLLKQDGPVLTATLGLVDTYQLDGPGLENNALLAMIRNSALPEEARSMALNLLVKRKPGDLDAMLQALATDASDDVALTALASIAKSSPSTALPLLETAIKSGSSTRAQKTWAILAGLPGDEVDALFIRGLDDLRSAKGISPSAIELAAAAKKRKAPSVREALSALDKSLAESSDPLAKWNAALEGGDPVSGAALFASHPASECMRCHRSEEGHAAGGETAPNLAGIANRHKDRRYLLESMVAPSAVIAPGFGAVLIDFKNGASLTGNLIADTPDHLDIDSSGKQWRVSRSDIASVTTPTSPMPPMAGLLNVSELRDLVAWLATLDKGGNPPATAQPVALDPATLKTPEKPSTGTPAPAPASAASPSPETTAIDPAVMKAGKQQFMLCGACHGQSGEGTAAGPPLAGSEWVNGPEENLIRIQLRGLQGPIKVKGQEYNIPGGMAPLAYQKDEEIASVLTFIRNSFGNSAPPVAPASVTALRDEATKPPLRAEDLVQPAPPATAPSSPGTDAASPSDKQEASGKYDHLEPSSSLPKWIASIGALLFIGIFLAAARKGK